MSDHWAAMRARAERVNRVNPSGYAHLGCLTLRTLAQSKYKAGQSSIEDLGRVVEFTVTDAMRVQDEFAFRHTPAGATLYAVIVYTPAGIIDWNGCTYTDTVKRARAIASRDRITVHTIGRPSYASRRSAQACLDRELPVLGTDPRVISASLESLGAGRWRVIAEMTDTPR